MGDGLINKQEILGVSERRRILGAPHGCSQAGAQAAPGAGVDGFSWEGAGWEGD